MKKEATPLQRKNITTDWLPTGVNNVGRIAVL